MKYAYASAANLLALALLPLLLLQGKRTRRNTPRLPEAAGARHGLAAVASGLLCMAPAAAPEAAVKVEVEVEAEADPAVPSDAAAAASSTPTSGAPQQLSLLAIGESPVAGVGVRHQHEAITSCFAQALAQGQACTVAWRALGKNGATVADAIEALLPQVAHGTPFDIVLVAFGVNDTSSFRSLARFERDLRALLEQLLARCQPRLLLLSGVPPLAQFPALPQPLRSILGLKAAALDASCRSLVTQLQKRTPHRVVHVPLTLNDPALMASDGYHPSAAACRLWGQGLAEEVARLWPGCPARP